LAGFQVIIDGRFWVITEVWTGWERMILRRVTREHSLLDGEADDD
jgi:hypothetical protein